MLRLFRISFSDSTKTTSNVATIDNAYDPAPVAKPIAAVAHKLAAVVMPITLSCSPIIAPAPMKPIPVTIPAAILAGSTLNSCNEIIVKRHAPRETSMWVLNPAGL